MTSFSNSLPNLVYARRDPDVDPPSIALGLDLVVRMTEGAVVSFVDDEADPVRDFDLHWLRGAFRISQGLAAPEWCFASPEAAIRAGWVMVDALFSDADVGIGSDLPPLTALLGKPDPTGGAA